MSLSSLNRRVPSSSSSSSSRSDAMLMRMLGQKQTPKTNNNATEQKSSSSATSTANASSASSSRSSTSSLSLSPSVPLSPLDESSFLTALQTHIAKTIDSEPKAVRLSSLQKIDSLLQSAESEPYVDSSIDYLVKPVLKRLADEAERCREASGIIIANAIKYHSNPSSLLPLVIPIVKYRLGVKDIPASNPGSASSGSSATPEFIEPSEEIRVSLLRLIEIACDRHSTDFTPLEPFLADFLYLLLRFLPSNSPECREISLRIVANLALWFRPQIRSLSPQFVALVMPSLVHKLARVRLAALSALRQLIPSGAAEQIRDLAAFRESNVIDIHGFFHGESRINYFARLVFDENPRVRHAFFHCLFDWLENLYERADYETLLYPYFLTGLGDSNDEIQMETLQCLQRLGKAYEADHEEEMKEIRHYGQAAERESRAVLIKEKLALFPPFEARPTHAERAIARKFLDRLLHAICTELNDWKGEVQRQSATLLRSLLLCAEEHIAQYASTLIPAFLNAIRACEAEAGKAGTQQLDASADALFSPFYTISPPLYDCFFLFGRYCPPVSLLEILSPFVDCSANHKKHIGLGVGMDRMAESFFFLAVLIRAMPLDYFIQYLPQIVQFFVDGDGDATAAADISTWQFPVNSSLPTAASFLDFFSAALERLTDPRIADSPVSPALNRFFLSSAASVEQFFDDLDNSSEPVYMAQRRKLSLALQQAIKQRRDIMRTRAKAALKMSANGEEEKLSELIKRFLQL